MARRSLSGQSVLDWRDRETSEELIAEFASADRALGFNLADARLLRVTLLRLSDDQYQMIWTSHHILMDALDIAPQRPGRLLLQFRRTGPTFVRWCRLST